MSDDAQVCQTPVELYEALQEEKHASKEGKLPVQSPASGTMFNIELPALGRTISAEAVLIEDMVKNGAIRRQGSQIVIQHPW